jgi:hypothetical protein
MINLKEEVIVIDLRFSGYDPQDCYPKITNKDLGKDMSITRHQLVPEEVAIPCGLIADTYFNGNTIF